MYFIFIIYIFWLIVYLFPLFPKLLKLLKIVLSVSYMLEYSVAWCILGECELSWYR